MSDDRVPQSGIAHLRLKSPGIRTSSVAFGHITVVMDLKDPVNINGIYNGAILELTEQEASELYITLGQKLKNRS